MRYVKLFESWLQINEAENIKPEQVVRQFPIDAGQWGTMHLVTGKQEKNTQELAKYLTSKLSGFSKKLKTKFTVSYNKKDDTVEIVASNRPNEKFVTVGQYLSRAIDKSGNVYPNTIFTYSGWIDRDGEKVSRSGVEGEAAQEFPLGIFIASVLQDKDVEDVPMKQPSDMALNIASVVQTSEEGSNVSTKDIVGKMSSGSDKNLAPSEPEKKSPKE